jgi:hypothetical protein
MNYQQDLVLDHRARLERARQEATEKREQALFDQRSLANSTETRVRTWEKLHQVRLPKDPGHNILLIVAQETGMTLQEVQEVQRQRGQPPGA